MEREEEQRGQLAENQLLVLQELSLTAELVKTINDCLDGMLELSTPGGRLLQAQKAMLESCGVWKRLASESGQEEGEEEEETMNLAHQQE